MTDLKPHQQRVVSERTDLDEKRQKLSAFLDTDTCRSLDEREEQERLAKQLGIMEQYVEVLDERIAAFTA